MEEEVKVGGCCSSVSTETTKAKWCCGPESSLSSQLANNIGSTPKTCCSNCCKEGRNNGRACLCQVPQNQRRGKLGENGCVACGCTGCHPQDLENKLQQHSGASSLNSSTTSLSKKEEEDAQLKNGCCKPCMKAFSETGKSCLCQVPSSVRMGVLPEGGCKLCRCKGCHPEELLSRKQQHQAPPPHMYKMPPQHYMEDVPPPMFYPPYSDPFTIGYGAPRRPVPASMHRPDGLLPYPMPSLAEYDLPPYHMMSARWDDYEYFSKSGFGPHMGEQLSRRRLERYKETPYDRKHSSGAMPKSSDTDHYGGGSGNYGDPRSKYPTSRSSVENSPEYKRREARPSGRDKHSRDWDDDNSSSGSNSSRYGSSKRRDPLY
ncbi:hypothetical protein SAMD00019534_073300 [Acytostelium subglobosum LB1]|uniref:hypothetical protein n=1 Tax=Acytostelium subglobosum LB1 TaxID=1410327 RepID=UPI000644ACCF|nr:hypothetical protein SAMD00019534_073300 [Acytostelium subglobosum LB1]GAM24155.1 hypothetical protein SAMD00019534_073300 [Acytostelium subglobosum LB1]|eukprot:XP_012753191.1 hypothetical protein SAMD00019534_073300 [Acytostelium subglobosum LB1]